MACKILTLKKTLAEIRQHKKKEIMFYNNEETKKKGILCRYDAEYYFICFYNIIIYKTERETKK